MLRFVFWNVWFLGVEIGGAREQGGVFVNGTGVVWWGGCTLGGVVRSKLFGGWGNALEAGEAGGSRG
jgi:hypothetical protein